MKKFVSGAIIVMLCYIAGIAIGVFIEGFDTLGKQFTGIYALLGASVALVIVLLYFTSTAVKDSPTNLAKVKQNQVKK